MHTHSIAELLDHIITQELEKSVQLQEQTALIGEEILDSLEFMNYLTKVEKCFDIKISDADVQHNQLGIIGNMIRYLHERTA